MMSGLINANPIVYKREERRAGSRPGDLDKNAVQIIDQQEIFKDIKDPEHPYSLEELNVITEDAIEVDNEHSHVQVMFTPTISHCSLATIIGVCLRVKLMRSLPSHYKVDIKLAPGTHVTEDAVNKQMNDKERVAAALEYPQVIKRIKECLAPSNK